LNSKEKATKNDFRRAVSSIISVLILIEQKSFYHLKTMTQKDFMSSISDDVDREFEIAKK
jgi:hypothetical protein